MFDHEGSRSEFLKLLAELGEEPAFIARGRAPQLALDALLRRCDTKRAELLEWPTFHLSVLAHQIRHDWSRLGCLLNAAESVSLLEELHAKMQTSKPVPSNWLANDRTTLLRFLESADRFNRNWRIYIDGIDLEGVNKPRRDYNQFYVLEKSCAFASEKVMEGFAPLTFIDHAYLDQRYPLLIVPTLKLSP